jgi:hypothetical protein
MKTLFINRIVLAGAILLFAAGSLQSATCTVRSTAVTDLRATIAILSKGDTLK